MQTNTPTQQASHAARDHVPATAQAVARLRTVAFSLLVDRALAA
ncbi:hypothetical protein [Paraburkholderia acidisoli]|nr:hypothetical protein [Paraburkholderia acidisoli]